MPHDDFQTEPVRGLPEKLPEGEHILWQGRPNWWALTKESLSFWWVAGYFAFLFLWRTIAGAATMPFFQSATAASFFLVLGAIVCALLMLVGLIQARATMYTLTNKRVAMRIGAALTLTLNLPFRQVMNADLSLRRDGTGTIALQLNPEGGASRLSYLTTWPHVRPWRMKQVEPALRCIPEAQSVARLLADAAQTAVSEPVMSVVPTSATAAGTVAAE